MKLVINGEEQEFSNPLSVEGLLTTLQLDPTKVALERNLEIISHSAYKTTALQDGDQLEIVHFIGGG